MIDSHDVQTRKLGFFRGADFAMSVGQTDWRIGLFLPEFGFETWMFGRGRPYSPLQKGVTLLTFRAFRIPFLRTLQTSMQYASRAIKMDLDIVICNPGLALAGILCKRFSPHTKVILDVRTVPVEPHGLSGLANNLHFATALNSRAFDGVSIISEGMLDMLDERHNIKARVPTVVWASGFDHEIFIPTLDGDKARKALGLGGEFVLMYHGAHARSRGLQESIRCVRILYDSGMQDIKLVLIGHGPAKPQLAQLAAELGVKDQVMFFPPVPHTEIPDFVAATDLGIDALSDRPWWQYQSPLKVYEYLAMGKPVIATEMPCHQDISEAVLLVGDNAPSTLADEIARYRNLSEQDKSRLRDTALQDAQRYTWRGRAEVLAHFLKSEILAGEE
jgi:glycosyltransferase involved in cell wall biosynthesis